MKTVIVRVVFIGALAATMAIRGNPQPQKVGPHETEFRAFYAEFVKAVRANDKEKIADMIVFPVTDWSLMTKGESQTLVKDKADFLARYNVLFTNYMRLHIPKAKGEPLQDGWFAAWKDANSEYSFDFVYVAGTGFRIRGYNIGAY